MAAVVQLSERALGATRAAQRLFAEQALHVAIGTREDGVVDFISQEALRLLACTRADVAGRPVTELLAERSREAFFQAFDATLRVGTPCELDLVFATGLGGELEVGARVLFDAATRSVWVCGHDLSASRRAEAELRRLAMHDPLTGLANKLLLAERVGWHISDARRLSRRFAVIYLDLDGFKKANDAMGHMAGDALLKEVGSRLRAVLRDTDTVGRIGGDEFVLLLSDAAGEASIQRACDRVLEAVRRPVFLESSEVHLSTSMGAAVFPDHGETAEELFQHADMAMYQAKQAGKNRLAFYHPQLSQATAKEASLGGLMYPAIREGEFLVHYQPIVDRGGVIKGCETLLRWRRPDGSMIAPDQFIPVAEANGLINLLGDYVMRAAALQLKRFDAAGLPGLYVSVNVSPRQLRHPDFVKNLRRVISMAGIAPERIVLEITEGILMNEQHKTQALLQQVCSTGVSLSLDDFGTGYSCLAYLKSYPISTIKVDRSFLKDLATDPASQALVKAILDMARALSLRTVVEGVETTEQAEVLGRLGADFMQGYLYSKPLPAEQLLKQFAGAHNATLAQ